MLKRQMYMKKYVVHVVKNKRVTDISQVLFTYKLSSNAYCTDST